MIGKMRHALMLEIPVDTPDGGGGVSRDYQEADDSLVFAAIEPLPPARGVAGLKQAQTSLCRIVTRHRGDIAPEMRLTAADAVYTIMTVTADADRRFLIITAEKETV